MRKACIELMAGSNAAFLFAGDLGTGQCLHMVVISEEMKEFSVTEKWAKALALCQQKAVELKYEVSRIRGGALAGLSYTIPKKN
ncbi:hypothetical protein [Pantoea endophytica]